MAIREVTCETAMGFEGLPDGGRVPVIDAYDGCQLRCPYCFQWADKRWNQDILVKTNLPEVLAHELHGWDLSQPLYVGSRSDPYMPLEEEYQLTRKTLRVLNARKITCFLSTKAKAKLILRDIELFLEFQGRLTMCLGLAHLYPLQTIQDQRKLPNISAANQLARSGINTRVFITPVLPGITDVEAMIGALDGTIQISLDRLRLTKGNPPEARFFRFVRTHYPELESRYCAMMAESTDSYYDELKCRYHADPRISFVFGDA